MQLVGEDIKRDAEAYGITEPDSSIDFRRVVNLNVFFKRNAASLTTDIHQIDQWQAGDIVVWKHHIGVISDHRNKNGIPFVIHHANPIQASYEEDILAIWGEIIGHYRIGKENKDMKYRFMEEKDDAAVAALVRDNLKAKHLDIPGTVYFDKGLDHLSQYYLNSKKRAYYVILDESDEETIIGGIGFAEFDGIENCAELQKLYLTDAAKGKGLGYQMIQLVEEKVREAGYKTLYLETHTNLEAAIHIYEKYGFREIERPAAVVHSTMNKFYIMSLE